MIDLIETAFIDGIGNKMAKIKNKYKVCYQNSTKTWNNFENMFLFSNTKLSNKFKSRKWQSISRSKNFNINDLQKKWRKRRFIFAHNLNMRRSLRFYLTFLSFKEFKKYIKKDFFKIVNRRLDVVLFKMNFFNSIFLVKNFIKNYGVYVNGKKVNSVNFMLKRGDVITFKGKGLDFLLILLRYRNKNIKRNSIKNVTSLEINEKIPAAVFLGTEKTTNTPEVLKDYKSFYFKFFQ